MTKLKKASLTVFSIFLLSFLLVSQAWAEPYGWSPNVDNSWGGPPTCTDAPPDKAPILLQPNHPVFPKANEPGAVRLFWHKVPGATGYNVYYGLSPRNYIFAAPDLGDTDNFTVRGLANRTYYFAVQAKKGCAAGELSNEWSGRAGGSIYQLAAAPGFVPVTDTILPKTGTGDGLDEDLPPTITPEPTDVSEVEGITAKPQNETFDSAVGGTGATIPQRLPTQPPQQKGFFGAFLDFIAGLFGK